MISKNTVLTFLLISMTFFSCQSKTDKKNTTELNTKQETKNDKNMANSEEIFKNKVIVFLTENPDLQSKNLSIQDFIENGKSFIPVFTSNEKLIESTKNTELPYPKYQIDGIFLLSILNGNETLRINPTLIDEITYNASDLKEYYKSDIKRLMKQLTSQQ